MIKFIQVDARRLRNVHFIFFVFTSLSLSLSACLDSPSAHLHSPSLSLSSSLSRARLSCGHPCSARTCSSSFYLSLTRPIKGTANAYTTRNNEYIYRDIRSLSTIRLYDTLNASASVYAQYTKYFNAESSSLGLGVFMCVCMILYVTALWKNIVNDLKIFEWFTLR